VFQLFFSRQPTILDKILGTFSIFMCTFFIFLVPLPSPTNVVFMIKWLQRVITSRMTTLFSGGGGEDFLNTYNAIFINALKQHIFRQCSKYFSPRLYPWYLCVLGEQPWKVGRCDQPWEVTPYIDVLRMIVIF